MKASWTITIIVFLVLVLLLLTWILPLGYPNAIPIFNDYGIEFGASPKTIIKFFGDPIRSDAWSADSVSNIAQYSFQITYMEKPVRVSCGFLEDRSLCEFDMQITCASEQETHALFEKLVKTLKADYDSHKDYYYRESETGYKIELGLFDGAAGIQYEIEVVGYNVTVSGINQK